jgi:hypothetical protein
MPRTWHSEAMVMRIRSRRAAPLALPLTLREAAPCDAAALEHLAALDSAEPPRGPLLVAERDARLVAALSLADGQVVADPFQRTADVVSLLRYQARRFGPRR